MNHTAYVNGEFIPLKDAKISILDRGFLFADAIYEVSAVLDGRLVDKDSHMLRLQRSVGEIQLPLPETLERIIEIQIELIRRNNLAEGIVYIEVTRGVADRDFVFPKDARTTLVMFTQEKTIVDSPAAITGIAVKSVPDIRWARRDTRKGISARRTKWLSMPPWRLVSGRANEQTNRGSIFPRKSHGDLSIVWSR